MKAPVKRCIEYIGSTLPLDAAPRRVVEVIAEFAVVELGQSAEDAAEFAELNGPAIGRRLAEEQARLESETVICRFTFNSSSDYLIQGSSFVEASDGEDVVKAKNYRLNHDDLVNYLKGLTWEEFEACCRGILRLMGCDDPKLTSPSHDQGIDFYGRLSLEGRLDSAGVLPGIDRRLRVWMVGQAKHYQKTKVSTPDLRELVGSVKLAVAGSFSDGGAAIQQFDVKLCDPIFYLFFTTGTISADGKRLLTESGMIGMDGSQVATFLADSGVGVVADTFEPAEVKSWIKMNELSE